MGAGTQEKGRRKVFGMREKRGQELQKVREEGKKENITQRNILQSDKKAELGVDKKRGGSRD